MFNGYISVILWWTCITHGWCTQLDVNLNHENSGFFIKPLLRGEEFFTLNKDEKPFIITQNSRASSFEAQYGPFHDHKDIDEGLIRNSFINRSSYGSGMIIDDLEISAHLVSNTVSPERPVLQVLFHASHFVPQTSSYSSRYYSSRKSTSQWCMHICVERDKDQLSAVCILDGYKNVCIAEVKMPVDWWTPDSPSRSVNVYYTTYSVDAPLKCLNVLAKDRSNPSVSITKHHGTKQNIWRLIRSVSLTHGQVSYQELKEDQHILIYVPQKSFYPGAKFRVPVKLGAGSDLNTFIVRVRAKHGLSLVGADPKDAGTWKISPILQSGERRGSVEAKLNRPLYTDHSRILEVFDLVFEVDKTRHSGHEDDDSGRIILTLEYSIAKKRKISGQDALIGSKDDVVRNKVVAKVQIQHGNIYSIVPVIKTTELINTAFITGITQHFSMHIYSVSQSGQIEDITKETTCHSGEEHVLKVSQSCDQVYLDGTETEGRQSVSVIAKYDRHSAFLFFQVWIPEVPLELELSDQILSNIKSWKIPPPQRSNPINSRSGIMNDDNDYSGSCGLKFQQSIIEVYARFYIADQDKKTCLVHRKALFRVTDLVSKNLRVADESVAMVKGNVVFGLKPGRTEVQVMSRLMRPIGAKELSVTDDKVSVKMLKVKVISGFDLDILSEQALPGTLSARIITHQKLLGPSQEAFLDISVEFTDKTIMPIHLIPNSDYALEKGTVNRSVVEFTESHSCDTPKIKYIGPGKGELLQVSLRLGEKCERKKPRKLTSTYVYVDCQPRIQGEDPNPYTPTSSTYPGQHPEGNAKNKQTPDAQVQKINNSKKMSHLEIGMYVLLGVFIIAILVFVVNCIIFMNRHHKKRGGSSSGSVGLMLNKRDTVSNANDWVWIGRDTLERNAINTGCNQALMSEQDFTVNKNVARFLLPQSNPSSNRSSCTTGNGGSNRNSVISTYKGSECSIRITPNPISNDSNHGDYNTVPRQRHAAEPSNGAHHLCRPPLHTFHSSRTSPRKSSPRCSYPNGYPALSDIQSTSAMSSSDERGSCSSLPSRWSSLKGGGSPATYGSAHSHSRVPTPQQQARFAQVAAEMAQRGPLVEQKALLAQAAAQIAEHEEDVANGNLTDSSVEWDYEAMGMTYEQLMEYFDNLKESTA